ncbi:MAG: twin-arginine translocase subunit TatC [Saprospiraceae bacterium]
MPLDQMDVDRLGEGEKEGEKEMSFLDHLEELRWHIIRSIGVIAALGILIFVFNKFFFDAVIFGPTRSDFISYKMFCKLSHALGMGTTMCFEFEDYKLQAIQFAETFITTIKVSFILGFIFSFPYVFWEIWTFVKPGLYPKERNAARGIVFVCSFLFLVGVLFGYFIIAPFATNFLMTFTLPGVDNSPTLQSYIGFLVMFTLPTGLVFELPIVVYFLSKVGLVTPASMRQYRRHSIIGILILAAVITPPDVITQFLIGIPLYVLYELSIFVSARANKAYEAELDD